MGDRAGLIRLLRDLRAEQQKGKATDLETAIVGLFDEIREELNNEIDKATARIDELQRECEQWQADRNILQCKIDDDLDFHPRAMKLIGKRKAFVVVAVDEPYFIDVYQTIRANELKSGRWTDEDERQYQNTLWG